MTDLMTPNQAAWVRENVWKPIRLRNHNHIPSTTFACACQKPPSVECQRDWHSSCRHDGHPVNETVIHTSNSRAARLPDPYDHPSPVRSGRNDLAWVWLAGAPCREICTCGCHRPASDPVETPLAKTVQRLEPAEPLLLF
ncbi:hypothetical protein [Streptomyces scabiei]|uniref:hypothetical protein n=1 Tax=Streptomyces scabiei TaxID=1930 RepID=UPI0004E74ADF|nr:hypothetical protein [Streptomyces scabiei]KFG07535.1 hypothetical protein IQ61_18950 [Streptomyces scabiei]MDX3679477.1 hypothetical protein [Streptomyces scabiei]